MATHSNILAWRIPWTEKPGGLSCMGSQRVRTEATQHTCTQAPWCTPSRKNCSNKIHGAGGKLGSSGTSPLAYNPGKMAPPWMELGSHPLLLLLRLRKVGWLVLQRKE